MATNLGDIAVVFVGGPENGRVCKGEEAVGYVTSPVEGADPPALAIDRDRANGKRVMVAPSTTFSAGQRYGFDEVFRLQQLAGGIVNTPAVYRVESLGDPIILRYQPDDTGK